jgi:hypothetical protein
MQKIFRCPSFHFKYNYVTTIITLVYLIYQKKKNITSIQIQLQSATLPYNGDFENKMHHIFGRLKLKIHNTFVVFVFLFLCMYWFGLLHNK